MANVIGQICIELEQQEKKWGQQEHTPPHWMNILMEEVGEAARAVNEYKTPEYRKELVQVAAVAIAAIDSLDRSEQRLKRVEIIGDTVD